MTYHLDSHTTTDVKPDMLSDVQTVNGIQHDRYNIRGIAHVRTNRKDNIFMQRRLGKSLHVCVCVFIPSPVRVGTLLMEVPWTPIGASFFEFELKPTGKDSADPTQHEFQACNHKT